MSSFPFEDFLSVFAWLAGACFCGLLPLAFALILFFSARKRQTTGAAVASARPLKAASLQPAAGLVRLQGQIAPHANPLDGSPENGMVYLRLKVEVYERDEDSSGWRGLTDKERGVPFQLDDGSGMVWVNPAGLDKQLLGDGVTPSDEQIEAACILLGISPKMLRGELRFTLWELRAGQTVTVVGNVAQDQQGNLILVKSQKQPFIITPLLGQAVEASLAGQAKKARIWMFVLGIPGLVFLLCGLGGALINLIRILTSK